MVLPEWFMYVHNGIAKMVFSDYYGIAKMVFSDYYGIAKMVIPNLQNLPKRVELLKIRPFVIDKLF